MNHTKFNILYSGNGTEEMRLGLRSEDYEKIMGIKPKKTSKNSNEVLSDTYRSTIFIYYDNDGNANAFEFFQGFDVFVEGISVFESSREVLIELFKKLDFNVEYDEYNLKSKKLQIAIRYDEDEVHNILVGCEGYYK